jgi:hypothetical protein
MTMHHTPGDHFSMLTGDRAAELAQILLACLRTPQSDDTPDALSTLAAR